MTRDTETIETVWNLTALDLRAHALAYGLTDRMELSAMVEAVARAIDADRERYVRPRRYAVEVR